MSKVNNSNKKYAPGSSIKPDSWYKSYIEKEHELGYSADEINPNDLKDEINFLKKEDSKIDIYQFIDRNEGPTFENIPHEVLNEYYDLREGSIDTHILFHHHNLKDNKKLLEIMKAIHENLKRKRVYDKIFNSTCKGNLIPDPRYLEISFGGGGGRFGPPGGHFTFGQWITPAIGVGITLLIVYIVAFFVFAALLFKRRQL